MKDNGYIKVFLGILLFLMVSGCAMGGRIAHTHASLKPIKFDQSKAYVYFYRPCKIWGVLRGITVSESEDVIGGLNCNSYFVLEANPGTYNFHANDWIRKERILRLDLGPGQEYFIKTDLKVGIIDAVPSLILMDVNRDDVLKGLKRVPHYQ